RRSTTSRLFPSAGSGHPEPGRASAAPTPTSRHSPKPSGSPCRARSKGIRSNSGRRRGTITMISKIAENAAAAVKDIHDGATVMIGGFGTAGQPVELIDALLDQGARELTVVNNNAGNGTTGLAALLNAGRVRKIICSFPRQVDSQVFDGLYRSG